LYLTIFSLQINAAMMPRIPVITAIRGESGPVPMPGLAVSFGAPVPLDEDPPLDSEFPSFPVWRGGDDVVVHEMGPGFGISWTSVKGRNSVSDTNIVMVDVSPSIILVCLHAIAITFGHPAISQFRSTELSFVSTVRDLFYSPSC
jgi:hypothetical protein